MQRLIKARIAKTLKGPGEEKRAHQPTFDLGEVVNARGEKKTARKWLQFDDYWLTGGVEYLMKSEPVPGTYTPAKRVGSMLVSQLPESSPLQIS